jgi:hypothetical protein
MTKEDELEVALKALRHIKDNLGGVCETYEICTHRACSHSYGAWATASEALDEIEGKPTALDLNEPAELFT